MPNQIIVGLKGGGWIAPRMEDYFIRTGRPEKIGDEAIIWTFKKRSGLLPEIIVHHVVLLESDNGYRWLVER